MRCGFIQFKEIKSNVSVKYITKGHNSCCIFTMWTISRNGRMCKYYNTYLIKLIASCLILFYFYISHSFHSFLANPQGINPTIKVWELELSPGNESNVGGTVIAEFSGHKYAVNCVV